MTLCKTCGGGIEWEQRNGKWRPVQPGTGKPHWPRCKNRSRKKRRLEARKDHIAAKPILGEDYRPSCGQCPAPPWEVCACSSLLPVLRVTDLCNREADERLQLALLDA